MEKRDEPHYEYTDQVKDKIPILNPNPNIKTILEEAQNRAAEIAEIAARRDAHGGRAG